MNEEYKKIFASLKEEKLDFRVNGKVLIIDGLNTFLRSFTVIRHINYSGNHIGGLTGFLRSLGYLINLVKPSRVIVVFDGQGGSTNKRYIYPEYKANRGTSRVTNWDGFESQQEESEAIINQVIRLVYYLKCLPVDLLSIDKIEADDVIGYITQKLDGEVIIASSDKDYLQLINDKVSVYSPVKRKFYNRDLVIQEYKSTPNNFLTQKILLGDAGDNVPGVKGLGAKTLEKHFPMLKENVTITYQDVVDMCKDGKAKIHRSIEQFHFQMEINRKLMDLKNPNIPDDAQLEIDYVIENPNKEFESVAFAELYKEDKLGDAIPNVSSWLWNHFTELKQYK
jgi:DNA polymerase-1